jgi:2-polyprenyl-3-methyl-5-hydroxy-6-metoxy-1,4-benzoquinol methylase
MKAYLIYALQKLNLLLPIFRFHEWVKTARYSLSDRAKNNQDKSGPDGLPLPPTKLIVLVAGDPSIMSFLRGGEMAANNIKNIFQNIDVQINEFSAILDFGCGCGRVIRQFHSFAKMGVGIYGSDYNPVLIDWCQKELGFANFSTNQLTPPLKFDDEKFDLIYSLSVFTHLPESLQSAWINELARILKPGGYLLFSTHGEADFAMLNAAEKEKFRANELVVRYEEVSGTNMCAAFHPEIYVREQLTQGFEVMDFIFRGAYGNGYQDLWLLRKL